MIKKRLLCTVMAVSMVTGMAVMNPLCYNSGVSVSAYTAGDKLYDDEFRLYYNKVDEDEDGVFDYIQVTYNEGAATDYKGIEEITIPEKIEGLPVTYIGDGAFANCVDLKGITLPETIEFIWGHSFKNCTGLEYIKLPDSLKSLGDGTFSSCTSLKEVVIGSGLTRINPETFSMCINLEAVTIGANVSAIEPYAFSNCEKLESIEIPEDVAAIGFNAFSGCKSLKDITVCNRNCEIFDSGETFCNEKSEDGNCVYSGTIYGYKNSSAQLYAKKYGYKFEIIEGTEDDEVLGDVNGDGVLNVRDAAYIAKFSAQGRTAELPMSADFNGDGKVNIRDAAAIAKHLVSK